MNKKLRGIVLLLGALGGSQVPAMHAGAGLPVVSNGFVAVSAQGSIGLLNGTAQENVYVAKNGWRNRLSELDWDLKNVVIGGGEITLAMQNKIWFNAGLWGSLTQGNGQMNDWDWLLEEPGSPWTDWSLNSVDVTGILLLDLNVAVEMAHPGACSVRGIAGYKYNTWKWDAHALQHIYSINGGFRNDIATDDGSVVVIYQQTYNIPYLGVGLNYTNGPWAVDAYALVGPYVTAQDLDQHVSRQLDFEEDFTGGQYYGAGLRVTYAFHNGVFLAAALDAQMIPEIIGNTTVTDLTTGQQDTILNDAGIANKTWMFSLAGGYKF